ncbi:Transcriptional regulator, MarR family [hydrothermal vent metagenome]|uniref:Transcriptional regulator, MarR family n=1 Tax=hydrothermal vent metagenome TaxID=652676 RepID=A0A3B0Y6B4_9ZZZZ
MVDKNNKDRDSVAYFLDQWRRERPDLDPWSSGVTARLQRLSRAFLRDAEANLKPLDLTWEAFSVIVTLRRVGEPFELSPGDLLREGLLTSGAVTNRIDRVERLGLVKRHPDPKDRRGIIVRLTPAGKQLADVAIEHNFSRNEELLSILSKDELAQLSGIMSKLLLSIEKRPEIQSRTGETGRRKKE